MDKYFVIGHPVKHSLSPEIHKMFAAQFDIEMSYETRDFEPGGFIEGMAVLRREDSPKGANVTHPFKMDAYQYCDEVTPRARKCEAANTLIFDGNRVLGDTTDGKGFVNDVTQRCGASLTGARVLILGAGGAGRGLAAALQEEGCARIYIANRTPERAHSAGAALGCASGSFVDLISEKFDIIVNATSAAFSGAAPAVPNCVFSECSLAVDLTYAALPTPFMQLAKESGAVRVEDGLGMLVAQAAESFALWTGRMPDTKPVYEKLRAAFDASVAL